MTAGEGFVPVGAVVREIDPVPYLALLDERFGIPPESFDEFLIFRPNRKWLAIADRRLELPPGADFLSIGMPFMYDRMRDPRLTTAAAVKFGVLARRNVLDLDLPEVEGFVTRRDLRIAGGSGSPLTGPGYVIARHRGILLGLGHARADGDSLVVAGMVPRSWPARR